MTWPPAWWRLWHVPVTEERAPPPRAFELRVSFFSRGCQRSLDHEVFTLPFGRLLCSWSQSSAHAAKDALPGRQDVHDPAFIFVGFPRHVQHLHHLLISDTCLLNDIWHSWRQTLQGHAASLCHPVIQSRETVGVVVCLQRVTPLWVWARTGRCPVGHCVERVGGISRTDRPALHLVQTESERGKVRGRLWFCCHHLRQVRQVARGVALLASLRQRRILRRIVLRSIGRAVAQSLVQPLDVKSFQAKVLHEFVKCFLIVFQIILLATRVPHPLRDLFAVALQTCVLRELVDPIQPHCLTKTNRALRSSFLREVDGSHRFPCVL